MTVPTLKPLAFMLTFQMRQRQSISNRGENRRTREGRRGAYWEFSLAVNYGIEEAMSMFKGELIRGFFEDSARNSQSFYPIHLLEGILVDAINA